MNHQYYDIELSMREFPRVAKLVRDARAIGIEVVRHRIQRTRYGSVRQHSFTVKEANGQFNYYTNSELSGMVKIIKRNAKQ